MTPRLHIGNKNYSSWSMRPWLALSHAGVTFETVLNRLPDDYRPGQPPAFVHISPTGRVPVLEISGVLIADSLAICEWAAEQAPGLWPETALVRAQARSAAAIMHSGFPALRQDCPMNLRRRTDPSRMTDAGRADAALMDRLWCGWLERSGGPFLFGRWSVADAMYAPAASRFLTYDIPRSAAAEAYISAVLGEPHAAEWIRMAHADDRALARTDCV